MRAQAKQSIERQKRKLDCFASLAMTLRDSVKPHPRDLAARCARGFDLKFPPSPIKRARGMPGARCARGLVCISSGRCAHEHTGHTGITRHSPRNGLRLISCSPRRPGFLPPSPARLSADLTPASGCRAHTILLVRLRRARPSHPPRPPQPAPRT